MNQTTERCEVCSRVIRQRPNPRMRRCGDCVNVVPLFSVAMAKNGKRGRAPRTAEGGSR